MSRLINGEKEGEKENRIMNAALKREKLYNRLDSLTFCLCSVQLNDVHGVRSHTVPHICGTELKFYPCSVMVQVHSLSKDFCS